MDLPDFERWLRERDGAVLVAEERVVRRVVKHARALAGLGLRVPHARCAVVDRGALFAAAKPSELGVEGELPARVILLARPPREIEGGAAIALARALFHARVHAALDEAPPPLDALRARVHAIGEAQFDEIRRVLRQDDHLLVGRDADPLAEERATFDEFVALWLELGRFDPRLRDATFPGVRDAEATTRVVAEGLDVDELFAASCPPSLTGASEPVPSSSPLRASARPPAEARVLAEIAAAAREDAPACARLRAEAASAFAKGNAVRAALLSIEALHRAPAAMRAEVLTEARAEVASLARRLDAAVGRPEEPTLVAPLLALAHAAARPALGGDLAVQLGLEARALHDLQNACIAAEREVRKVDVFEWARTFGRRPVVRTLSASRELRVAREVHAAARKVALVHAASDDAADLHALRRAVHALGAAADASARRALGPKIARVLDEVGLRPSSVPERVAAAKLEGELLDVALARGRLDLGHLRDAISRNDLKLRDLGGTGELVSGDPLLRADARLAEELDGVYRRGEIYLRWLQKVASLFFGTRVGRAATLYLIVPLLGAFVLLEGVEHVLHPLLGLFGVREHHRPHVMGPITFPLMAAAIFALLHSAGARRIGGRVAAGLGFVLATVFFRLPLAFARLPLVRRVLRSEAASMVRRHVLRPLVLGALAWLVLPDRHPHRRGWHGHVHVDEIGFVVVTLASFVLFLTRYGSAAEEIALDYAVRSFRHLRTRVLPGVVRAIAEAFAAMVEASERLLYAVDERLRFRQGEGLASLVGKGALGLVWGFVAFWIRIYVNLLIEPQVNPIKHFPVVTVSHKIMLPMAPQIVRALVRVLAKPLGRVGATAFASITVLLVPGVFGFLAWEMKEDFKLYGASRPSRLRAATIGHHGETMAGLLKPGFHSGTIPKLSAKIRRAARVNAEKLAELAAERVEIEEALERFVQRELSALLEVAPEWRSGEVAVRDVDLGANRVRVTLRAPRLAGGDACIAFEEQSGFIVAGIAATGFLDALDDDQRAVFEAALAGLYARAAVDLVREQIEAELAAACDDAAPPYDVADDGLLVWPGGDYGVEIVYPIDDATELRPVARDGSSVTTCRPLRAARVVFARQPIDWASWSATWPSSREGARPSPLGDAPSLLPRRGVARLPRDDGEGERRDAR